MWAFLASRYNVRGLEHSSKPRGHKAYKHPMEPLLVSTAVVAIAEIGDKTQLLSFVLAARHRKPVPIILGILVATLLNHALAGAVGVWVTRTIDPGTLRWVLGIGFIAMAGWALIPDRLDQGADKGGRLGVFVATTLAFFLVEMGDKTQVATVALVAQYDAFVAVVSGTTIGMMLANVPAVMVGERLAARLPLRAIRIVAAASFAAIGLYALVGARG